MFSAILILLLLPITDVSRSRGMQFRPLSKVAFYVFIANFLILMQLGAKHVESPFIELGQGSTFVYFVYFVLVVSSVTIIENTLINLIISSPILSHHTYKALSDDAPSKDALISLPLLRSGFTVSNDAIIALFSELGRRVLRDLGDI
jgi:Cytochrome b(C-terminal)/b6/petD